MGVLCLKKKSCDSTWSSIVNKYIINSLRSSTTFQRGSISNRTTLLFPINSPLQINEKSFSKYTITPCRQDGKLSPIIFNNHRLCDNKYESLKESKDTDSKVTSDDNKSGIEKNICTSNENIEIISIWMV